MGTVGVLCARVRVEEKQLLAALAEAGVVPMPLPPAEVPLPVGRGEPGASGAAPLGGPATDLIVDRCQDRAVAGVILRVARALGLATLDAGLAATGDRLAVAAALAEAGLPRPATRLATGEAAVVAAIAEFGYPSTLLPLPLAAGSILLPDIDTAEAVVEHRAMLGAAGAALVLVQAGTAVAGARWSVVVVGGRAVAATGDGDAPLPSGGAALAEEAAGVLRADMVGIEIVAVGDRLIVWDARPVPDFRGAVPLSGERVADAVARLVVARGGAEAWERSPVAAAQATSPAAATVEVIEVPALAADEAGWQAAAAAGREVRDGVPLLA